MKKFSIFTIVFTSFFLLIQDVYSQESSIDSTFYQKCDSLISEINSFEPESGSLTYDLYIINNVTPMTIEYLLMMKEAMRKSKEDSDVKIDFEFIINGLIYELEELRRILE